MADPANATAGDAPKSGPSLIVWLAAMAVLTLVAVGGGGFIGLQLVGRIKQGLETKDKPVARHDEKDKPADAKVVGDSALRDLPPIVTNLLSPSSAMIRIQATIVFENKTIPHPEVISAEIAEDFLSYLRTVTVAQIEGASGLQHLRDDLNERASIRSDKKVRDVIIQSLVVQ